MKMPDGKTIRYLEIKGKATKQKRKFYKAGMEAVSQIGVG